LNSHTIGRDNGVVIEDHLKDDIDIGSKVSALANCSDDTNTSQILSSVLMLLYYEKELRRIGFFSCWQVSAQILKTCEAIF